MSEGLSAARALLFAGMLGGLGLALSGLLEDTRRDSLPPGVLARVGTQELMIADYQRAVNGVQSERRGALDEADRQRILERMIDEFLLLEHARRLDLDFQVPMLRKQTVDQVLQMLRTQAESLEASDAQLETFLREHPDYFRAKPQYRARAYVAISTAAANRLMERLRQGSPPEIESALPDGFLPMHSLTQYLGPSAARAVGDMEPGAIRTVARGERMLVLQLLARETGETPQFADVRAQVQAEWRRRAGEQLLASLLRELRAEIPVQVNRAAM